MKVKEQVMRWVFAATAAFSIAAVALICVFLKVWGSKQELRQSTKKLHAEGA